MDPGGGDGGAEGERLDDGPHGERGDFVLYEEEVGEDDLGWDVGRVDEVTEILVADGLDGLVGVGDL